MLEEKNFNPIFEKIESRARADGARAELLIERSEKLAISFQKRQINKFDSSASHTAGLRVIVGEHVGYAFSENLSEAGALEAYQMAFENAKFAKKGGDPAFVSALLDDASEVHELGELFNDSLSSRSIEEKIERARVLEASALDMDSRIASVPYAGYSESEGELQLLSSTGLRRRQRWTAVGAYAYCLAKNGDEARMSGESRFTRDAGSLDVAEVGRIGAQLALAKLGASQPETGRYPVVFENEIASQFLSLVEEYFSAKAVDEKNSIFGGDRGRSIASKRLSIVDDPFYRDGINSRAFDSEGAASRKTDVIKEGVLENFLTNSIYARKLGLPHTASAARSARTELGIGFSNLIVKPGQRSLQDLMNSAPKVIYITELNGLHSGFSSGSGDFSLPAEGELWENGKLSRPLCNFVVAGNVRDLFMGIEDLSNRVASPKSHIVAPDMLIGELSVAGK